MSAPHIHEEDFGLLIEAGFIAVKQGNRTAAKSIFDAAYQLRPSHSASKLGFGYMALHEMHLPMARTIFESVLKEEPKNGMAKVLLGFSFLMERFQQVAGKKKTENAAPQEDTLAASKKGVELINEALSESKEPGVINLGKSALELADKVNVYLDAPLKK